MLSQRIANIAFAVMMIAAAGYFAWLAQGFEAVGLLATSGLPSKFFPQLMLGCVAVCAIIVIWEYGRNPAEGKVFDTPADARRGLLMLVVTVVCYLVWREFGFVAMAVILGPLSLLAMGIRNPVIYAVVWALTLLIWVIFTYALGVQLV